MICTNCGTQISDNSAFCYNCGFVITTPVAPPEENNEMLSGENIIEDKSQIANDIPVEQNTERISNDRLLQGTDSARSKKRICKFCQTEIPKGEKTCPICGSNYYLTKKNLLIAAVVVLLISPLFSLFDNGSKPVKSSYNAGQNDTASSSSSIKASDASNSQTKADVPEPEPEPEMYGIFNVDEIKTLRHTDISNYIETHAYTEPQIQEFYSVWAGYNYDLNKAIETSEEMSAVWEKSSSLLEKSHLLKVAALFGETEKYENKYFSALKGIVLEKVNENRFDDDTLDLVSNNRESITTANVLSKVDQLYNAIETALNAKTDYSLKGIDSLSYDEKKSVENSEYFGVYIYSRIKNSQYFEFGGVALNEKYIDEYMCGDIRYDDKSIVVSFINQPSQSGEYYASFEYVGTGSYTDYQGFEMELDKYKEVSESLFDAYYYDDDYLYYAQLELMEILQS